jgi:hypothetical protein
VRSALLLLGGLVLIGAGIAVLALGAPGAVVLGPALLVAGVLVKVAGFLLTGESPTSPPSGTRRTVTTLGSSSGRARGTGPELRTSVLRRVRTARAARATARSSEVARAAALDPSRARRRLGRHAS